MHGPHGKPELEPAGPVRFNFSRSGSFGLLAVTRGRDVGVDVERVEPRRALGLIADRLFDADEAAELRSLPGGAGESAGSSSCGRGRRRTRRRSAWG